MFVGDTTSIVYSFLQIVNKLPSKPAKLIDILITKEWVKDKQLNPDKTPPPPIPLSNEEKNRFRNVLNRKININIPNAINVDIEIKELLQRLAKAVKNKPYGKNLTFFINGSFVFQILGRSYIERYFKEALDVDLDQFLSEEDWAIIAREFNKTFKDLDIQFKVPDACDLDREYIVKDVVQVLADLRASQDREAIVTNIENWLRPKAPNIIDKKRESYCVPTPLGSDFCLDINWVKKLGREEMFEKDGVKLRVEEDLETISVECTSNLLTPFLHRIYSINSVKNPETANNKVWARLQLEELKGNQTPNSSLNAILYKTAKGEKSDEQFLKEGFIEKLSSCLESHTDNSYEIYILLILQALLNLHLQGVKITRPLAIKPGASKTFFSFIGELLNSKMDLESIFDICYAWQMAYGLKTDDRGVVYDLNFKSYNASYKNITGLKDTLQNNRSNSLLFLIVQALYLRHSDRSTFNTLIISLPEQNFESTRILICPRLVETYKGLLKTHNKEESLIAACFQFIDTFEAGYEYISLQPASKQLELSTLALKTALKWHFTKCFTFFCKLFPKIKNKEEILNYVLPKLLQIPPYETPPIRDINLALLQSNPALITLDLPTIGQLRERYPELSSGLAYLLMQEERFEAPEILFPHLERYECAELRKYVCSLSDTSVKSIVSKCKGQKQTLKVFVDELFKRKNIETSLYFRILFAHGFDPVDLEATHYRICVSNVISALHNLKREKKSLTAATSIDRLLKVAGSIPSAYEIALLCIDLKLITKKSDIDQCINIFIPNGVDYEFNNYWDIACASPHRMRFLARALTFPRCVEKVYNELKILSVGIEYLIDYTFAHNSLHEQIRFLNDFVSAIYFKVPSQFLNKWIAEKRTHEEISAIYDYFEDNFNVFNLEDRLNFYDYATRNGSPITCTRLFELIILKESVWSTHPTLLNTLAYCMTHVPPHFLLNYLSELQSLPSVQTTNEIRRKGALKLQSYPAALPFLRSVATISKEVRKIVEVIDYNSDDLSTIIQRTESSSRLEEIKFDIFVLYIKCKCKQQEEPDAQKSLYSMIVSYFKLLNKEGKIDLSNLSLNETQLTQIFVALLENPNHADFHKLIAIGFFDKLPKNAAVYSQFIEKVKLDDKGLAAISYPPLKALVNPSKPLYRQLVAVLNVVVKNESAEERKKSLLSLCEFKWNFEELKTLLKNLFHMESLRPRFILEIKKLSFEQKNLIFKSIGKTIYIKAVSNPPDTNDIPGYLDCSLQMDEVPSAKTFLNILFNCLITHPDKFDNYLYRYLTQAIRSTYPMHKIPLEISRVNKSESSNALPWFQDESTSTTCIVRFSSPPHKAVLQKYREVFANLLQQGVVQSSVQSWGAKVIMDMVAHNLFEFKNDLSADPHLVKAYHAFLSPNQADPSIDIHLSVVRVLQEFSKNIYGKFLIGTPVEFSEKGTELAPFKQFFDSNIDYYKTQKLPVVLRTLLHLLKVYSISSFKECHNERISLCMKFFDMTIKYQDSVLNAVSLSEILNTFFPISSYMDESVVFQYSSLIDFIIDYSVKLNDETPSLKSRRIPFLLELFNITQSRGYANAHSAYIYAEHCITFIEDIHKRNNLAELEELTEKTINYICLEQPKSELGNPSKIELAKKIFLRINEIGFRTYFLAKIDSKFSEAELIQLKKELGL